MSRSPRKMIVVLAQRTTLPHRTKAEDVLREFTVYALTRQQAIGAVRNAGHKGRLVEVVIK